MLGIHTQLRSKMISSSYGLFAMYLNVMSSTKVYRMTTTRPEVILLGSNDRKEWQEYHFKYKAGALNKPPVVVAPHQPRLDWQVCISTSDQILNQARCGLRHWALITAISGF